MHPEPRARRSDPSDRDDARPAGAPRADGAPRPLPLFVVAALVLLIGLGLGWMGRYSDAGGFRGAQEFSRLGGPWLVGAYVTGVLCAWRRGPQALWLGAAGGAVAIALGSLAYYGLYDSIENGYQARQAIKLGVGWAAAGVVVGGVAGGLGALVGVRWRTDARDWWQGASVGTLGGLLIGEAIALLWVWESLSLRTMATLEGLGGAGLVLIASLGRSWRWVLAAFVATAVTATVAPIATTMVRETLRSIGWNGA